MTYEQNVKAILESVFAGYKDELIENACKMICTLNDSEKQVPKTGHWIRWYETIKQVNCTIHDPHCKCSECNQEYEPYIASLFNYCPNCGTKMKSEE